MRKVYGKGLNFAAQINSTRKNCKQYEPLQQLTGIPIKQINCGYLQSYFELQNGQILKRGGVLDSLVNIRQLNFYRLTPYIFRAIQKFSFLGRTLSFRGGNQNLTTINMQQLKQNIICQQAQFGLSRIFFKDQNNKFYAVGQNYFGQLGTRDTMTSQTLFRYIQNPANQKIQTIKCGFQHTLFITESGNLYGCGKADSYQIQPLNFKSRSSLNVTDKITEPSIIWKGKVKHVGCGFKHTVFSTENNQLYSLGNNKYGQCGHSYKEETQIQRPKKIYFPLRKQQKIIDIKCGFNHSLVLTNHQLYFFGCTQQNQNPFQKYSQNISSPTLMKLPFRVEKVFSNFDRIGVIGQNNECLIFGGNNVSKIGGPDGEVQDLTNSFKFSKQSQIGLGFSHTIIYP